jgi:hypothetical protein
MIFASRKRKREIELDPTKLWGFRAQYSFWIWGYLIIFALRTCLRMDIADEERIFVHQNVLGLFLGTQVFWMIDRYDILYQIGKRKPHLSKWKLHFGDLFVHATPYLVYRGLMHTGEHNINFLSLLRTYHSISLYIIVPFLHLFYGVFIRGIRDVGDVSVYYHVITTRKTLVVGWVVFFISYLVPLYILASP